MPFLPLPANPDNVFIARWETAPKLTYAQALPTPVGQPKLGFRLGFAEADTTAWTAGADVTVPVSAGIRLFAIRGDFDYWQDTGSGPNRGGDAFSALALFGPASSYEGAGLSYASRFGHASGPSGAGIKLVFGSKFLPVIGYEVSAILSGKGSMAAIMATIRS